MSNDKTFKIKSLYRYPIKGFSPQLLERVNCKAGEPLPFDRAFAVENGPSKFDSQNPRYLPKISFLMLMRDERLATLHSDFDDATQIITIYRDGKQVASGQLTDPTGRRIIEQFLSAYMNFSLRGAPKVVYSPGHSFSDVPVKCLHLVNLASVRELERTIGRAVDPLRFRANVYFDTDEPWEELSWVGKQLSTDSITLSVIDRTQRCEATNVNPEKGIRDMAIPTTLQRTWGHSDFGIYAKVASDGELVVGNELKLNL